MSIKVDVIQALGTQFVCTKCGNHGAYVEKLTIGGMWSRSGQYAAASCQNCGYTELYNLKVLTGRQNRNKFIESILPKEMHMPPAGGQNPLGF